MSIQEAYEFVTHKRMLVKRLYDYLCYVVSDDIVKSDLENGILTIYDGFDGKTYIWYADELNDVAICVDGGMLVDGTEGLLWWE